MCLVDLSLSAMVLSGAERARCCREKMKATGLSEIMKKKDRDRKRKVLKKYVYF